MHLLVEMLLLQGQQMDLPPLLEPKQAHQTKRNSVAEVQLVAVGHRTG
jgi:hypothetical protein